VANKAPAASEADKEIILAVHFAGTEKMKRTRRKASSFEQFSGLDHAVPHRDGMVRGSRTPLDRPAARLSQGVLARMCLCRSSSARPSPPDGFIFATPALLIEL